MAGQDSTSPLYIAPFDLHLFGRGEHWDIYRILGAHPAEQDGTKGYNVAVWAPNVSEVHLCGDFNEWRYGEYPLYPVGSSGIWAAFVPGLKKGSLYKFGLRQRNGRITYKSDPYALFVEKRPGVAAIAWDLDNHDWRDQDWMNERATAGTPLNRAISIYEVHIGSWKRTWDPGNPFMPYLELADQLIPYALELGFTHLELMPVAEHPLDESWGYQTGNYFAPTSRFGRPEEFKEFIDRCHKAGLGVILDWVPAHFPKDDWGLGRFDGTALYEHADPRRGEHPDWGTYIFNYGRHEVRNFLMANALYWLKEFHLDGLRLDAVASMLYLDYSRQDNEWLPNAYGGKENLDAIDFLRELNRITHAQHPGTMMIAEESTSWPGVSRPVYTGGLGFSFKWNMGWMHDTLEYMSKDPVFRPWHHHNLTFSMLYAFSENFILPLSHDEVVHGKGSLAAKMPGDIWQKQANLRLLLSYMWAHPGKKMLFMGGEFGQWNEWSASTQLDWELLKFPTHQGILRLTTALNHILKDQPAMHEHDHDWSGFEWVDFQDHTSSVISFLRKSPASENNPEAPPVLWIFNFTPVVRYGYKIGCPVAGWWQEIFNSDSAVFGGSNVGNDGGRAAQCGQFGHMACRLELTLPPLAALAFTPTAQP